MVSKRRTNKFQAIKAQKLNLKNNLKANQAYSGIEIIELNLGLEIAVFRLILTKYYSSLSV
jgi:hypothetical protein